MAIALTSEDDLILGKGSVCDVKAECEKRVEKQDAFSVCENECSSSASLERHVGDGVDEIIESVSVNAELVEKPNGEFLYCSFPSCVSK